MNSLGKNFLKFYFVACVIIGCMCYTASVVAGLSSDNFVFKFSLVHFFCVDGNFDFFLTELGWGCWGALIACSACVLIFVGHYFGSTGAGDFLSVLLTMFIGIMFLLFISGSWLCTFVFWDLLGIISMFLILFNLTSSSFRGAIITLFVSRLGDAALFVAVAGSHWVFFKWEFNVLSAAVLMLIVTKSALFPLTVWLPEAMRAPTPVSSLVHSSTLVAAGAWFMFRYVEIISGEAWQVLFGLSVTTIIVSALLALVFDDLKKLVALSTCNNIAWCVVVLLHGGPEAALAQLIVHGVCKCALFVFLGDVISSSGGSQSASTLFSLFYWNGLWSLWCLLSLILCLCGFPFLGLFFSKHAVFTILLSNSMLRHVVGLGFCLFLTSVYSFRLVVILIGRMGLVSLGYVSSFLAVAYYGVLGTFLGAVFTWSVTGAEPSGPWSLLIIFVQVLGSVVGIVLGKIKLWYPDGVSSLNHSDTLINRQYLKFVSLTEVVHSYIVRWEPGILNYIVPFINRRLKGVSPSWVVFCGGTFLVFLLFLFGR